MSDLKQTFWDRMSDCRTGMLSANNAPAVPMSHHVDTARGVLWFITAKDTDLGEAAAGGTPAQYLVSNDDTQLYARIDGTLTREDDREKLDELWSAFTAAWFEDGKKDGDVQLMRMDLSTAEVWVTGGKISYLYEVAKANMQDTTADAGEHGTVRF